jgi:hypothetical protein
MPTSNLKSDRLANPPPTATAAGRFSASQVRRLPRQRRLDSPLTGSEPPGRSGDAAPHRCRPHQDGGDRLGVLFRSVTAADNLAPVSSARLLPYSSVELRGDEEQP